MLARSDAASRQSDQPHTGMEHGDSMRERGV